MSNLIDHYIETTFPSSEVYEGMIVKIYKPDFLFKDIIEEGTVATVVRIDLTCTEGSCIDDHKDEPNPCHCRREILVMISDEDGDQEIVSCHCTLYTLDNKLIISDDKHIQKRR